MQSPVSTPTKQDGFNPDQFVCPGQRLGLLMINLRYIQNLLGHIGDFQPGQGTYIRRQHIYASVVGFKDIDQSGEKPILSVTKEKEPTIVPELHSVVIGRVNHISSLM